MIHVILICPFKTLEACMKNCGGPVHDEVATRELMDELRTLANVCIQCDSCHFSCLQISENVLFY